MNKKYIVMINREKQEIAVQGSSWKKVSREKISETIRKLTHPFIFTATTMAKVEGEMKVPISNVGQTG